MDSQKIVADRIKRLEWWHEARFGMFVHWGLYSQTGRHEWVMNRERIPAAEYEKLADTWKPTPGAAREWAQLAKAAGMKYMVLTTKHHEGFSLWDSKLNDFNAVKRGPKRDLVQEYVKACREAGLKVGFYYSLMDWHHADGHACARDEAARRRFTKYTQGLVRELMSNYGKIDILWYDVSWPLDSAKKWESKSLNAMVRKLQPQILINDRSQLPEDFGTPEEHIVAGATENGRGWEACMTFNGAWGWMDTPAEDWHGPRKVLALLNECTSGGGNLLLNIGPKPDGSVPAEAVERLRAVGAWLAKYGEATCGKVDRVGNMEWNPAMVPTARWTRKGNVYYYWVARWPGSELVIGGLRGKVLKVGLVQGSDSVAFDQELDRLVIRGLPAKCPDAILGVAVLRIEFDGQAKQVLGCGLEPVSEPRTVETTGARVLSPFIKKWAFSLPVKAAADISKVAYMAPGKGGTWQSIQASGDFVNLHAHYADVDAMVYLATNVNVDKAGAWDLLLGHDGPAKVFIDGKALVAEKKLTNPSKPDRTSARVSLTKGTHEIEVVFDLAKGKGWGIFLRFAQIAGTKKVPFPKPVK